jgi:squalene-hopene/tetraprenyl-beta-curcumene cyclase
MTPPVVAFEIAAPETAPTVTVPISARAERKALIAAQAGKLWDLQQSDGHIVFELEADCTIPSEYILLRHFLGETDKGREARIALYLREVQNSDGSWSLYRDGPGNISATVKGYWALKLAGEDIDAQHMARARTWVLGHGGAAKANVFTRFSMAMFGRWRCSARSRGAACRRCRWNACCCRSGSPSTCRKSPIGRVPCWRRC